MVICTCDFLFLYVLRWFQRYGDWSTYGSPIALKNTKASILGIWPMPRSLVLISYSYHAPHAPWLRCAGIAQRMSQVLKPWSWRFRSPRWMILMLKWQWLRYFSVATCCCEFVLAVVVVVAAVVVVAVLYLHLYLYLYVYHQFCCCIPTMIYLFISIYHFHKVHDHMIEGLFQMDVLLAIHGLPASGARGHWKSWRSFPELRRAAEGDFCHEKCIGLKETLRESMGKHSFPRSLMVSDDFFLYIPSGIYEIRSRRLSGICGDCI